MARSGLENDGAGAHIREMRTDIALLGAAAVIGVVLIFLFRYEVIGNAPMGVLKFNRITGSIEKCGYKSGVPGITCE